MVMMGNDPVDEADDGTGVHDGPGLRASLEAILLVVDEPVAEVLLAQVLERPREEIARELASLAASYQAEGRGFELREVAGGWRFYTREECAPVVERFVRDGQEVRLTQALLTCPNSRPSCPRRPRTSRRAASRSRGARAMSCRAPAAQRTRAMSQPAHDSAARA